jgi:TetR/AcrR family fatty acid metabolism transcriptional regulator
MKKNNKKYHQILEAACKVFAETGFYQSTISMIAKEAGVADGTIYLYFKSKDDILVQFHEQKSKQVFDRFRKAVAKADSAVDKLRNLIHSHLEEFQKDPNMAVVYQAEVHQPRQPTKEAVKETSKWYRDIITEVLERGQEEGTMRRDLYISLVKRMVNGAVDEVINSWIHQGCSYDLVSMTEPLVDLFLQGIGSNVSDAKPSST